MEEVGATSKLNANKNYKATFTIKQREVQGRPEKKMMLGNKPQWANLYVNAILIGNNNNSNYRMQRGAASKGKSA
jgi:hypothetical protein